MSATSSGPPLQAQKKPPAPSAFLPAPAISPAPRTAMDILPDTRAPSWTSADDVTDAHTENVLEKGEYVSQKPSFWRRMLVGGASEQTETKRAMQSRHLTMIGSSLL